jgi:deoxyxylulose-5-phosphate synthase
MSLEKAIDHAAEHLPEGWTVHVSVEKGAGWVTAERPDETLVHMHEDQADLEEMVRAAVGLAHDEIAAQKLSEEGGG